MYTTEQFDDVIDTHAVHEREEARLARLRAQMKAQDERKHQDPDPVDPDLAKVWVVYVWRNGQWILAGFLRRRHRRKTQTMNRFFARIRRRLQIDKKAEVKLMDLDAAQRLTWYDSVNPTVWLSSAPQRVVSTRPADVVVERLARPKKAKVTRYRKSVAVAFHKRETTYVALGRNPWDRDPTYMYLGPLAADTERTAQQEADRTFGAVYTVRTVIPITGLSKRLRNAMHKARKVRPGEARLLWPEPVTVDEVLALPVSRLRDVSKRDALLLVADTEKRLRGALKSKKDRTEKIGALFAVLGFLYDLPLYPQ